MFGHFRGIFLQRNVMSLDKDILDNYEGIHTNSLPHVLHVNPTNDSEINILQHSPYIDGKELPNVLFDKSDHFNILSLNIQSINAKFDHLHFMLRNLHEQNCHLPSRNLVER